MLDTTSKTLIKLAALVWYSGVVVLYSKSSLLLLQALNGGAELLVILIAVLTGVVIGMIKAKYLFSKVCKKNIHRINALATPRLWQLYRKRFFFFLFLMVSSGKYLASVAQGNNSGLIALAMLELSVGTALLLSSRCFWENKKAV